MEIEKHMDTVAKNKGRSAIAYVCVIERACV